MNRLRDDIATVEATERLLKNASRPLPQHRCETLDISSDASEKNVTTGIRNKFTHLFSVVNSPQHQWPELHHHLEQRAGVADRCRRQGVEKHPAGPGRAGIARLSPAEELDAWTGVSIIANKQGSTLGELWDYFARTPDAAP